MRIQATLVLCLATLNACTVAAADPTPNDESAEFGETVEHTREAVEELTPPRIYGVLGFSHQRVRDCLTRADGEDDELYEFFPGDVAEDARSLCKFDAEMEVTVHDNWTLDIEAHERVTVGRTLVLRSLSANNERTVIAVEWLKLDQPFGPAYLVSRTNVLTKQSTTSMLQDGSGPLRIAINKSNIVFDWGGDFVTYPTEFLGIRESKNAFVYSWEGVESVHSE